MPLQIRTFRQHDMDSGETLAMIETGYKTIEITQAKPRDIRTLCNLPTSNRLESILLMGHDITDAHILRILEAVEHGSLCCVNSLYIYRSQITRRGLWDRLLKLGQIQNFICDRPDLHKTNGVLYS